MSGRGNTSVATGSGPTSGAVPVCVAGAGGHGRELLGVIRACAPRVRFAGFLDDSEPDDALLGRAFTVAPDVTEERHLLPGAVDPTVVLLRQGGGFGRVVQAGTALAGLVGASDGELTVGQILGGIAALLDVPVDALRAELVPQVRDLVADGFLLPG